MRQQFLTQLNGVLDPKTDYFLTADVGFGHLEKIQEKMGSHFINVGIREQGMISIASGIALSGYRVFTYTMCSFYLRALEQIRNDIKYHNANVKMIGVGIEKEYGDLGFTHWALEDALIIKGLGIPVDTVEDREGLSMALGAMQDKNPHYFRVAKYEK